LIEPGGSIFKIEGDSSGFSMGGITSISSFSHDLTGLLQQYINRSTTIGSTTVVAANTTLGVITVPYYMSVRSGAGSVVFTVNWTDRAGAKTVSTSSLSGAGAYLSGTFIVLPTSGSVVAFTAVVTGTISYDLDMQALSSY